MKNSFWLKYGLVIFLALTILSIYGCSLGEFIKDMFVEEYNSTIGCMLHPDDLPCDHWCNPHPCPGESNPPPFDDDDPTSPEPEVDACTGSLFSRVWVSISYMQPGYLWVALEKNEIVVAYSNGIGIAAGPYPALALDIPIDGLQLDTNMYNVSIYLSAESTGVGHPETSIIRKTGDKLRRFSQSIIQKVSQRPLYDHKRNALYAMDYCIYEGDTLNLAVIRPYVNQLDVEIVTGYMPWPESGILWSVGGSVFNAGSISNTGQFIAFGEAPSLGDCFVVAQDINSNFADTVGIQIMPRSPLYCTPDTSYAALEIPLNDAAGIEATINTKYGRLCGDAAQADAHSSSVIYCMVGKNIAGSLYWSQFGFGVERYSDSVWVDTFFFTETMGNYLDVFYSSDQGLNYPLPDINYKYTIRWYPPGVFQSIYEGDSMITITSDTHQIWQTPGTYVMWAGEIYNLEDDMPGTLSSKCTFANPQYIIDTGYLTPAVWTPGKDTLITDDPNEWGASMDTINSVIHKLYIWDKHPIP